MSAFVIKVKTDNAGTSNSNQFTLPGNSSYSYNFDVDWGDGSAVETINSGSSWTHTFAGGAGTYSVQITENAAGGFPAIHFNNGGDKLKFLEIEQWGTNRWDTFIQACYGCSNLTITATDEDTADTGGVTTFQQAFQSCSSLATFPLIDTSGALNFGAAWFGCSSLTSFPLIDASSVTNFGSAWSGCSSLTSFPLIDASSATSFQSTWQGCSSLTSFPLINTSVGVNFQSAWNGCSSLATFPLINTSSAENLREAWRGCSSLTTFPLINTSSATNLILSWFGCSSLASFPLIDTSNAVLFDSAWNGCSSLTLFPLIDTSSGTSFQSTWQNCISLTSFPLLDFSLLANGINTFLSVTLDTASYDAILANSFTNNVNNNVAFHGGNSKYAANGQAVRNVLTAAPRNWTITDGGFDATYVYPVESTVVPQLLMRRRLSGGVVI